MSRIPGAHYTGAGKVQFLVWAPFSKSMAVRIADASERLVRMEQDGDGYWKAVIEGLHPGARYYYRIDDNRDRPDPASHFQPDGVHGPSAVVDHSAFSWSDNGWKGILLASMTIYELHVGAFTPEGTFDAAITRLKDLKDLGVNSIELMPVAQFTGERNWGYDGVYPYAVQNSYGGPEGLKRLVDACHSLGLAVVLDVVYNHLGPEGNYVWDFGPYFTDRYITPWGKAINFDGPHSDAVRNYFITNALHWIRNYHLDGLRIDAIHGIFDFSAQHVLREMGEAVHAEAGALGRKVFMVLESDLNDVRFITPAIAGGYGLDAQWNDDYHHALHALVTGERNGYYEDFGGVEHMEKALREGFVYSGQFSGYRKRRHGSDSRGIDPHRFVVFSQNHDQVGNRMLGERLSKLASFEALKLAAAAVILSPNVPLLFMGEEYGEEAPFLYFVSHGDTDLVNAVRQGRRDEFKDFLWAGEPPDPQSEETFRLSKLDWGKRDRGRHAVLLRFYQRLLEVRQKIAATTGADSLRPDVLRFGDNGIKVVRPGGREDKKQVAVLFNFGKSDMQPRLELPAGEWERVLDSAEREWEGPGSLLPGRIGNGTAVVLRAESSAVYLLAEKVP